MESTKLEEKARAYVISDIVTDEGVAELLNRIQEYDKTTFLHSINVAHIVAQILALDKTKTEIAVEVVKGALLHDIGKIKIPKKILNKQTSLTPEDYEVIKQHPQLGMRLVEDEYPYLLTPIVKDIILHHHESPGGNGYPDKLQEIAPFTELVSIVDKYDAMTAKRCYGNRYPSNYIILFLMEQGLNKDYIALLNKCESK